MPATGPDPFTAQQRVDDFRAGLGDLGARLDRSGALDDNLDLADRNGWTARRIGAYVAASLANVPHAGPALAFTRLAEVCRTIEPPPAPPHAVQATRSAKAGAPWHQPRRPCGNCDGTPARWREVGRDGQIQVEHCPICWTAPPGYVSIQARNRHALEAIYGASS